MSRRDRDDPVVVALRKLVGTVKLTVTLDDDTTRTVPIPKAGNRWERLSKVLDDLAWVRIEALDKDGGHLGSLERKLDDEDDEEDDEDDEDGGGGKKLAKVLLHVMTTTMAEMRKSFEVQTRGMNAVMESVVEGQRALTDSYTLALRMQAASTASQANDGGETMEMLKMAMLLQSRSPSPPPPPQKPRPRVAAATPTTKES